MDENCDINWTVRHNIYNHRQLPAGFEIRTRQVYQAVVVKYWVPRKRRIDFIEQIAYQDDQQFFINYDYEV
jgi:hypothetical protein